MKQVPLYSKNDVGKVAIVDDQDFDLVMQFRWRIRPTGYLEAKKGSYKRTYYRLHRLIMNAEKGQIVDHINGDKLDNRRSNLRFVSSAQNSFNRRLGIRNKSGYKGVCWSKKMGKWKVTIGTNREYLGYYDDLIEAAKVYDARAKELYGKYAWTNFP